MKIFLWLIIVIFLLLLTVYLDNRVISDVSNKNIDKAHEDIIREVVEELERRQEQRKEEIIQEVVEKIERRQEQRKEEIIREVAEELERRREQRKE